MRTLRNHARRPVYGTLMIRLPGLALILAAALAPHAAAAQGPALSLNFGAGPTLPRSRSLTPLNTGFHAALGVNAKWADSPIAVRLEGLYDRFAFDHAYGVVCGGVASCRRDATITGVTANVVLNRVIRWRRQWAPSFYAIGGVGYYVSREPLRVYPPVAPGNQTAYYFLSTTQDLGWNGGAGVRIPVGTVSLYLEFRMHVISGASVEFRPLTLGLQF